MPTFIKQSTRQMDPRPGVRYATQYTRVSKSERRKLRRFVEEIFEETLTAALANNDYALLEPLKGFPRTGGRANYSAAEVMKDMVDQLESGKDVASGILGRWNRLFEERPDLQIDFKDNDDPENNFGELFR